MTTLFASMSQIYIPCLPLAIQDPDFDWSKFRICRMCLYVDPDFINFRLLSFQTHPYWLSNLSFLLNLHVSIIPYSFQNLNYLLIGIAGPKKLPSIFFSIPSQKRRGIPNKLLAYRSRWRRRQKMIVSMTQTLQ